MKKAVFCLANDVNHADRILLDVQSHGFRTDDCSVLFADRQGKIQRTEGEDYRSERAYKKGTLGTEKHTKASEGAAAGGTAGGIIGGTIGLLAGIGSLAIPGLGAFIAAGPLMAALSGSAIGGALGLTVGALVGLGLPEYEAKKYENALEKGHVLICVHAANSDQVEKIKEIFTKEGAKDIATSSETGSRHR